MRKVLGRSQAGGRFLMGELPLCDLIETPFYFGCVRNYVPVMDLRTSHVLKVRPHSRDPHGAAGPMSTGLLYRQRPLPRPLDRSGGPVAAMRPSSLYGGTSFIRKSAPLGP